MKIGKRIDIMPLISSYMFSPVFYRFLGDYKNFT